MDYKVPANGIFSNWSSFFTTGIYASVCDAAAPAFDAIEATEGMFILFNTVMERLEQRDLRSRRYPNLLEISLARSLAAHWILKCILQDVGMPTDP